MWSYSRISFEMNDNTPLQIESIKDEAVFHSGWFKGKLLPDSVLEPWVESGGE